jgi:hypothetical protein
MPQQRRFPPPWVVEETDACFYANGQALAYAYFEEEPGKRRLISSLTGTAFAGYATARKARMVCDRWPTRARTDLA